jgi:hypothetical protein
MIVSPGLDDRCSIDAVPAATLLFPYFSVDLIRQQDGTLASFRNATLFSLTNVDGEPHLARVTLWTNWALPTLSFDVYLAGYDVATFNVFDLLTGKAFENVRAEPDGPGPLSADNVGFPGCDSRLVGQGLYSPATFHPELRPSLDGTAFPALVRAHKGYTVHQHKRWASTVTLVWAKPKPVDVATGYITVDVVNHCSRSFPSDPGYFVRGGMGTASNENVLVGDYMIYEKLGGRVSGDTAVHIRAKADAFEPGDYTFNGRYVDGSAADGRQPLGTAFASRYIRDLSFAESANTYLLVWRDTKMMPGGPLPADEMPAWYPLGGEPLLIFDETTDLAMMRITDEVPLATQSLDLDLMGVPFSFGWMKMDLNHHASDLFGSAAQGWVTTLMAAGVESQPPRIHVGTACRAFRLASPCDSR